MLYDFTLIPQPKKNDKVINSYEGILKVMTQRIKTLLRRYNEQTQEFDNVFLLQPASTIDIDYDEVQDETSGNVFHPENGVTLLDWVNEVEKDITNLTPTWSKNNAAAVYQTAMSSPEGVMNVGPTSAFVKYSATEGTSSYITPLMTPIVGMIIMWYGNSSDVPEGWSICDGTNGTPDMRNRFPLGIGTYTDLTGITGGELTHTLTEEELPSHSHEVSYDATGWVGIRQSSGVNGVIGRDESGDGTKTSGLTGGGKAHNNMPPYYGLHFIMYTGF